ncbi:MAG: TIGR02186 family protein [Paracoccaceae bacterium]
MRRLWAVVSVVAGLACAGDARADEGIVAGLSQNRVSITADFDGSEILIYGAVRRDTPAPEGRLDVIITVKGPDLPLIVRRKNRVWGIWINDAAISVDSAPSFYAVATTRPLSAILTATENLRHSITIDRVIRAVGITNEADASEAFVEAMLRVRSDSGLYKLLESRVQLTEDTLFRTDISLPSNLIEGKYAVRMFLMREGRVVARQERTINVRKEGLERMIYNMAMDQPLLYGLLSLVLAAVSGWVASAVFRLLRP